MTKANPLLSDLDAVVSRGTPESRARALWHATDLMMAGHFSEDDIWTFGDLIGRLADEVEMTARARLAKRLARFNDAPVNVLHKLAFDNSIVVAAPILLESTRLEPYAMVANACLKSQMHMLAISKRDTLVEMVTDALVTRGNHEVVASVASNNGARLSEKGLAHMVAQTDGNPALADRLCRRNDIPKHMLPRLFANASDETRHQLGQQASGTTATAQPAAVAGGIQFKLDPTSKNYLTAKRAVMSVHQLGKLNEKHISGYARARRMEEVAIGLSLMCGLLEDVAEHALNDNRELLLAMTRTLRFSWETTMSLLFLGAKDHRIPSKDLKGLESEYRRLNVERCRSVLKSYQDRKAPETAA